MELSQRATAYPSADVEIGPEGKVPETEVVKELVGIHFIIDLQKSIRSKFVCRKLAIAHGVPVYSCDKRGTFRTALVMESRLLGRRRELSRLSTAELIVVAPCVSLKPDTRAGA